MTVSLGIIAWVKEEKVTFKFPVVKETVSFKVFIR